MDTKSLPVFVHQWFEEAVGDARGGPAFNRAQQVEPALAGVALADIPGRVRQPEDARVAAGLLEAVVRQYQLGDRNLWGPVLLEMLAPALASVAAEIVAAIPTDEEDDFCRQLVLETLHVAARTSTECSPRWLKLRIVRRARRRAVLWLLRDRRAAAVLPMDDDMQVTAGNDRLRSDARIAWVARRIGESPEFVRGRMREERAARRQDDRTPNCSERTG